MKIIINNKSIFEIDFWFQTDFNIQIYKNGLLSAITVSISQTIRYQYHKHEQTIIARSC